MTRKITSLLLVLAMVLGLCSSAWAAGGGADYHYTYYYYYDVGTKQMTPQNITIPYGSNCIVGSDSSGNDVVWTNNTYVVQGDIIISGNVKISGDVKLILCPPDDTDSTNLPPASLTINGGIYCEGADAASLTIYACSTDTATTGKLTVNGYTNEYDGVGHGINLGNTGTLTVHGGVITVHGEDAIDTTNSSNNDSYGIEARELTVHGGKLEVYAGKPTSGENTGYSMAIELLSSTTGEEPNQTTIPAKLTVTGGEIYAVGADVTAPSNGAISYGIYMTDGNMTVTGGKVTGKGGNVSLSAGSDPVEDGCLSTGIFVWKDSDDNMGNVEITGGDVYAIGQDTSLLKNFNSKGLDVGNVLTVTSGTLTAEGGKSYDSYGIVVGQSFNGSAKFTVNGGTVNATGGEAKSTSYGINGSNTLTISGGTVKATGGKVEAESIGVESSGVRVNAVNVSGGILNAKGGDVSAKGHDSGSDDDGNAWQRALDANSYGIYAEDAHTPVGEDDDTVEYVDGTSKINISGGTVNATAGKATVDESFGSGDDGNRASSHGIGAVRSITITGGKVNATADKATSDRGDVQSFGVTTPIVDVKDNGTLNATGDNVTTGDGGSAESYGIFAHVGLDIESNPLVDTGVITVSNTANVTAKSGKAAAGADGKANSVGMYAAANYEGGYTAGTGVITVSGGTVEATGSTATASGTIGQANSFGIHAGYDLTVESGNVTAESGEATCANQSCSVGIYVSHNLKVSDGTVTTTGGTATDLNRSCDILSDYGEMTVTGGTIKSNRASDNHAIKLLYHGELAVSGGKLKLMTSDIKSNSSESVKTSNGVKLADLLADKYGYYRVNPVTGAQTRISIDADQTTLDGNVSVRLVKHFRYHPDTVDKSQSATTGDPGIALYGVMTLLSYTGSALVIRGRKKF